MMGLLSTIRGKASPTDELKLIANVDVTPMSQKERKLVIQIFPEILKHHPQLFRTVWLRSAQRSNSIKKSFGVTDNEKPEDNATFMKIPVQIEAFFKQLIVGSGLDEKKLEATCCQLGARHVDFIARGFHSVCITEVVDETLAEIVTSPDQKRQISNAWQRMVHAVVHHMRAGYMKRQKEVAGNGRKSIGNSENI
ncbi:hypothetical protein QR680_000807 [Steinernema hermaphroditum]|uniref:Globin domain-containing protein n=1 Tax=Steinernema hermaphroditum TaxID=289476 RepID=A0AA39GVY6_9BILA|nr:hypothetical protein QR680_000807 [Steinernema hermaphroditum]